MTNDEYMNTQNTIMLLIAIVRDLPLDDFIVKADAALTIGPFVDPTLYRAAGADLEKIKRTAEALRKFQSVCKAEGVAEQ